MTRKNKLDKRFAVPRGKVPGQVAGVGPDFREVGSDAKLAECQAFSDGKTIALCQRRETGHETGAIERAQIGIRNARQHQDLSLSNEFRDGGAYRFDPDIITPDQYELGQLLRWMNPRQFNPCFAEQLLVLATIDRSNR